MTLPVDMFIAAFISFILSLLLLKRRLRPVFALSLAIVSGMLVGWQIVNILPNDQTSAWLALSSNPQLSIIWEATHNIHAVSAVAPYFTYIIMGFDLLGAAFGYILAQWISKRLSKT